MLTIDIAPNKREPDAIIGVPLAEMSDVEFRLKSADNAAAIFAWMSENLPGHTMQRLADIFAEYDQLRERGLT